MKIEIVKVRFDYLVDLKVYVDFFHEQVCECLVTELKGKLTE